MTGWRDIGTAPRDRTRILCFNRVAGIYVTVWDADKKEFPMRGWDEMDGVWYPVPSHWQPLPDPPVAA